jgi:hypothetical protein
VLLVDDLSSDPGEGMSLRVSARRMLEKLPPGDLVGLATTSGLGPAVNPTRDRNAVTAALANKAIMGRRDAPPPEFLIGIDEALEIERDFPRETLARTAARECADDSGRSSRSAPPPSVDSPCALRVRSAARNIAMLTARRTSQQLEAYKQAIQALAQAPAPRVLIALSSGLAIGAGHIDFDGLTPVSRAAAEAGVEFYALIEHKDGFDMRDRSPEQTKARKDEGRFLTAGLQTLANAARGDAFDVVGTPDRFFARIVSETSAFYRLGIELPVAPYERLGDIAVAVKRPGVTVRSHRQALLPK